jgi:hypothetical protein
MSRWPSAYGGAEGKVLGASKSAPESPTASGARCRYGAVGWRYVRPSNPSTSQVTHSPKPPARLLSGARSRLRARNQDRPHHPGCASPSLPSTLLQRQRAATILRKFSTSRSQANRVPWTKRPLYLSDVALSAGLQRKQGGQNDTITLHHGHQLCAPAGVVRIAVRRRSHFRLEYGGCTAPPELKEVTVDPSTTALLFLV